jgi:hypothetical protein
LTARGRLRTEAAVEGGLRDRPRAGAGGGDRLGVALVTDFDWIATAFRLFTWMTPGEARIFAFDELDEAKAWVAG